MEIELSGESTEKKKFYPRIYGNLTWYRSRNSAPSYSQYTVHDNCFIRPPRSMTSSRAWRDLSVTLGQPSKIRMFIFGQHVSNASMLSSEMFTQCDSWTSLIECWHFPLVKHSTPLSVTLVFERLRLWRNLQLWAMSWRDISVILMHPHKLRCSNWEQLCVKAATASSVSLTHLRRYTVWRQQQDENTRLIPSEETSSLEFLVAFKSNFRRFLQTQMKESPLSETAHSHNSSFLSAGCNTLNNSDNEILITSKTLQSNLY